MYKNKFGGENKTYDFNLDISETTRNNRRYLNSKKKTIEKILNEIIKLICSSKSQEFIFDEINKMPEIKEICKVDNTTGDYTDDTGGIKKYPGVYPTLCTADNIRWLNNDNLKKLIKMLFYNRKLKNMCKTYKYMYTYYPLFYNYYYGYPYAYSYPYLNKTTEDNDVSVNLNFKGGNKELLERFDEKYLKNIDHKLVNFDKLNDNSIHLTCEKNGEQIKCECDKCDVYKIDKEKLIKILKSEDEDILLKLIDYLYTSIYTVKEYHVYHNLMSDYKKNKYN